MGKNKALKKEKQRTKKEKKERKRKEKKAKKKKRKKEKKGQKRQEKQEKSKQEEEAWKGKEKKREIDKIGYTRVVSKQNRVPFFPRRGALTYACKTPPNRLLAPALTAPCVRAAPQTVFSAFEPSKRRQ